MRYKEITESTVQDKVQQIWHECKPFLEASNGIPLYRGMKNLAGKGTVLKKRVRLDDRTPKDMAGDLHNAINNFFVDKFGEEFRNAMFCSGDDTEVTTYGAIYQIFPVGDFYLCLVSYY